MAINKGNHLTAVRRFGRLLKGDKREISYIYLYAIFSGLLTLSLPLGIQAILGLVAGGRWSSSLVILVGVVTLGILFAGFLQIMQLSVMENIQRRLFTRSSFEFALRLPRLRLDALRNQYPPELANRFFDTLTLQKGLPKLLIDFSSAALQIIFGLLLISFYHPFFVFFSLILLLILAMIFYFTGPGGLQTSLKESKFKYKVAHWLQEVARTMTTFKSATGSQLAIQRTRDLTDNYLEARGKHFRILLSQYSAVVGFKTLVTAVLLGLGSYLVMDNRITLGQFVAAEIVVVLVLNSVEKLILTMDNIYDVLTGLEKIGQVTDLPLDPTGGLTVPIQREHGLAISARGLTFSHPDTDFSVLNGLDFDIWPGERICLVGNNASGRGTLVQILAALILSYRGSLTFDGVPAANCDLNELRHSIGYYGSQQDIFRGTVLQNLQLGHEEVDFNLIHDVVRQVGLEDFIRRMPQGYDTELLPEGRQLPRHIAARIMIARSMVARPRLLAMEDFLTQVQGDDRQNLIDLLTERGQPWTLVTVSDSPFLASRCDRILLMENGRITAQGSYEELRDHPLLRGEIFTA